VGLGGYRDAVTLSDVIETIGKAVDVVGVVVVVAGAFLALLPYLVRTLLGRTRSDDYRLARQGIGRAILLGLEFLVAGDIIRTVAVSPTFASVGVLGLIVLVRTFLSFSLEIELEGRLPWRRASPPTDVAEEGPAG
jgi:uncharacterized membrane protein